MATLTVCGSAGSYPATGRACSSYLLTDDRDETFVLDLGSGSLANIQRWVELRKLHSIFLSHDHFDHIADIVGLLQFTCFGTGWQPPLRIYAHEQTCRTVRGLQRQFAPSDASLELIPVAPNQLYDVGNGFRFEVFESYHSRPGLAVRVTDSQGGTVAYTGDSDWADSLVDCAIYADLLVSEATWLDQPESRYPSGVHMTGRQAGQLAESAHVKRLLVTHVWPEFDPEDVGAQARQAFVSGETFVADDNLQVRIGG